MGGLSFPQIIIRIIIVAACVGILYVVLGVFGIAIPGFIVTIFWIVLAAAIGIVAIKYVISLW